MPTFTKQERLKSRKTIGQLFKEGRSFVAYPLRVVWLEAPPGERSVALNNGDKTNESNIAGPGGDASLLASAGAALAITVPKKNFKTAVTRNLLKRRIREAWRLNKQELYTKLAGRRVVLMLMYIAKEELPFAEIEAGIKKMIRKFPV